MWTTDEHDVCGAAGTVLAGTVVGGGVVVDVVVVLALVVLVVVATVVGATVAGGDVTDRVVVAGAVDVMIAAVGAAALLPSHPASSRPARAARQTPRRAAAGIT